MTPLEIFNEIKDSVEFSMGLFYYFKEIDKIFHVDKAIIDFNDKGNSIKTIEKIIKEDGFLCFFNTKNGKMWYDEHKEEINKAFRLLFLKNFNGKLKFNT